MGEHSSQEVVEVVGNPVGEGPHALQLLLGEIFLLGVFEVCDIGAGTDVAGKSVTGLETRNTVVQQPAVLSIRPAQPVFHLKTAASLERG